MRKFVEAVITYTGSKQVNIISHGMGVTLARKVVKGGTCYDHQAGYYDIGPSIKQYVNAFIGIAGFNQGLMVCSSSTIPPFCGYRDGFFPGLAFKYTPSDYLVDINVNGGP